MTREEALALADDLVKHARRCMGNDENAWCVSLLTEARAWYALAPTFPSRPKEMDKKDRVRFLADFGLRKDE